MSRFATPKGPGFVDLQDPQPYWGGAVQATRRPRGIHPARRDLLIRRHP
jgi:hypothetical protein